MLRSGFGDDDGGTRKTAPAVHVRPRAHVLKSAVIAYTFPMDEVFGLGRADQWRDQTEPLHCRKIPER